MSPERRDVGRSGGIACPRAGVIATHDVGPPKIGRARVLARRYRIQSADQTNSLSVPKKGHSSARETYPWRTGFSLA